MSCLVAGRLFMVRRSRTSRHPGRHRNTKIGDPRDSVTGGRRGEENLCFWGGGLDVPRFCTLFRSNSKKTRRGVLTFYPATWCKTSFLSPCIPPGMQPRPRPAHREIGAHQLAVMCHHSTAPLSDSTNGIM
jgi:hypothetical protein